MVQVPFRIHAALPRKTTKNQNNQPIGGISEYIPRDNIRLKTEQFQDNRSSGVPLGRAAIFSTPIFQIHLYRFSTIQPPCCIKPRKSLPLRGLYPCGIAFAADRRPHNATNLMKTKALFISLLMLAGSLPMNAAMTDQQVITYIKQQTALGNRSGASWWREG
jgi:hypothetical protein